MSENAKKGRLIVFSAPSGCGKGTMLKEILAAGNYRLSVSATTRDPRPEEIPDVSYHYLTKDDFSSRVERNEFLEHAEYCDNSYGTLLSEVDPYLENGVNVILEIEVQGAQRVRAVRPDSLFIFVAPPSIDELRRRLHKRATEPEEVIEKRINKAIEELTHQDEYDYIIVNDALEDAVNDFFAVVRAEELKTAAEK
ncbi:MAG: guanylate kinase [Ruminococcus sp.]|nr:guanylate kinase [Ruminococcus sp.]